MIPLSKQTALSNKQITQFGTSNDNPMKSCNSAVTVEDSIKWRVELIRHLKANSKVTCRIWNKQTPTTHIHTHTCSSLPLITYRNMCVTNNSLITCCIIYFIIHSGMPDSCCKNYIPFMRNRNDAPTKLAYVWTRIFEKNYYLQDLPDCQKHRQLMDTREKWPRKWSYRKNSPKCNYLSNSVSCMSTPILHNHDTSQAWL